VLQEAGDANFSLCAQVERIPAVGRLGETSGFEQLFGPVDRKHRIYVKRATATRRGRLFAGDYPQQTEAAYKPG